MIVEHRVRYDRSGRNFNQPTMKTSGQWGARSSTDTVGVQPVCSTSQWKQTRSFEPDITAVPQNVDDDDRCGWAPVDYMNAEWASLIKSMINRLSTLSKMSLGEEAVNFLLVMKLLWYLVQPVFSMPMCNFAAPVYYSCRIIIYEVNIISQLPN